MNGPNRRVSNRYRLRGAACRCSRAQAEARRKQDVAVLGTLAAIDKDLAGLEIHIADLDLDDLARAHGREATNGLRIK